MKKYVDVELMQLTNKMKMLKRSFNILVTFGAATLISVLVILTIFVTR